MNWIEVIDLRSAGNDIEKLKQIFLRPILKTVSENGLENICLYHHISVKTDISIHLRWKAEEMVPELSDLGLRLAAALEEFGRINHSIWIEDRGVKE